MKLGKYCLYCQHEKISKKLYNNLQQFSNHSNNGTDN